MYCSNLDALKMFDLFCCTIGKELSFFFCEAKLIRCNCFIVNIVDDRYVFLLFTI